MSQANKHLTLLISNIIDSRIMQNLKVSLEMLFPSTL